RRAFGLGVQDHHVEAQPRGRLRQHPAELAAAENADAGAGSEGELRHQSSTVSATEAVRSARHFASRPARASSDRARIWAASRPALVAPASPMARVPTGTPPGIWTMESRESSPFSALDFTGTPSTGSSVMEATMPGRWAAPPAPAMMTLKPSA